MDFIKYELSMMLDKAYRELIMNEVQGETESFKELRKWVSFANEAL